MADERQTARLTIRLTDELLWQVKAAAVRSRLGIGAYVKRALQEQMKRDAE